MISPTVRFLSDVSLSYAFLLDYSSLLKFIFGDNYDIVFKSKNPNTMLADIIFVLAERGQCIIIGKNSIKITFEDGGFSQRICSFNHQEIFLAHLIMLAGQQKLIQ